MKLIYKLAALLAVVSALCSCQEDIDKVTEWPEWPEPADLAINGLSLDEMYYETYPGIQMTIANGQTVEFTGFSRIRTVLQEHYWDVTSETSAVFKGANGDYELIWDNEDKVLFTEPVDKSFPNQLFICGVNWGHQGAYKTTSKGWSWERPTDMMALCRTATGVYECSVFLDQNFCFKFGKDHLMGTRDKEIQSVDLAIAQPEIVGGNMYGDFIPGSGFQPGVYKLIVDLNKNTLEIKTNMIIEEELYYVDGVEMTPRGSLLNVHMNLVKGQKVTFGNFGGIESSLQPDFWTIENDVEGTAVFTGEPGEYDIYLDTNIMAVFTECVTMNFGQGNAIWVCGTNFGHPAAGRITSYGWDLFVPNMSYMMKKVTDNVFEATLFLPSNFCIKFFKARDWGSEASTTVLTPLPATMFEAGFWVDEVGVRHDTGDLVPGPDYVPGTYTIRVDYNQNIVYAVGYYNPQ